MLFEQICLLKAEVWLKFGGNDVDLGRKGMRVVYCRYTHKPFSPLMGSEAPCCGSGLSGNCRLIIHFKFQFLTTLKSNILPFSPNVKHLPP